MAPPTQAGKFKPRKLAKPIKVGSTQGAPIAVPSNTSLEAPSTSAFSAVGGGGRTSSRPGRGRGRGGRGFVPPQQGQVFFTGNAKPDASKRGSTVSTGSRASGSGAGATGGKRTTTILRTGNALGATDVQEEVVGVMEEGVGSATVAAASVRERNYERDYEPTMSSSAYLDSSGAARDKATSAMDRFIYDSDSSDDETRSVRSKMLQPIQLPILPRENQAEPLPLDVTSNLLGQQMSSNPKVDKPPFASANDLPAIRKEKEGFFLCQLPTRLVPFPADSEEADVDVTVGAITEAPVDQQTEVAASHVCVPSIQEDAFDNALCKTEPGRLGRILVYKSGKSVLELEGRNGSKILMNVTEGLSCAFRQFVACVDTDNAQLVTMGNVHTTVVVTPDLQRGFQI